MASSTIIAIAAGRVRVCVCACVRVCVCACVRVCVRACALTVTPHALLLVALLINSGFQATCSPSPRHGATSLTTPPQPSLIIVSWCVCVCARHVPTALHHLQMVALLLLLLSPPLCRISTAVSSPSHPRFCTLSLLTTGCDNGTVCARSVGKGAHTSPPLPCSHGSQCNARHGRRPGIERSREVERAQTHRQAHTHTDTHTHRHTDTQTHRHRHRQTQTHSHPHTHTHIHTPTLLFVCRCRWELPPSCTLCQPRLLPPIKVCRRQVTASTLSLTLHTHRTLHLPLPPPASVQLVR